MKTARLLSFAAGLMAVALFSLTIGVTEAQAGKKLTLNVNAPAVNFILIPNPDTGLPGTFHISGTVSGGAVGTFQCWGWLLPDETTTVVSQVYQLSDGQIMTQGIEGGLLAVVGGTGAYRNVRGQALQTFIDGNNFTLQLELTGTGGRGS